MKNLSSMPWMAYSCLLMEALALVFVILMLVCPAPFERSNLAVIVVQPNNSPLSNGNTTLSPISNTSTLSIPTSSSSAISTPVRSSTSNNLVSTAISSAPSNASTSASKESTHATPVPTNTSNSSAKTVSTTGDASTPTAAPTLTKRESNATKETFALDVPVPTDADISADNGTVIAPNDTVARLTQLERLNLTSPAATANVSTPLPQINSTILLRIGPLGSCFRTSDNVETCTSAKIHSQYDFTQLQQSSFITSGLPTGMSTYPTILLVIIVVLLLKAAQNIAVLFVPTQHLPSSFASPASGWHTICNWLVCVVCLLLAISSGIQRNKMSTAVKTFNTANQTKTMNSVPLLAQTGTSFGFIWISILLLAASFFLYRITIKRQAMLDRAKLQLLADPSNRYTEQVPLPMYSSSRTFYNEPAINPVDSKRSSKFKVIHEYLHPRKIDSTPRSSPHAGSDISLPSKVLDDYIRRHYHPSDFSDLPKASTLGYLHDSRRYAKESPPFHAYQSSLDGESRRQEEADYVEEVRHRMATPAPSYWTMPDRDQQDSPQTRREKERDYMAELRRQRSTMH